VRWGTTQRQPHAELNAQRRRTHQVDVEDLVGDGAQRLHDQWANRDVGHEAAVHHVDVDPVAASLVNGADLGCPSGAGSNRGAIAPLPSPLALRLA
jgi:hypothetical protein